MRSFLIDVAPSALDQVPGLAKIAESVLVEEVVPESGIEALHVGVLHGLSRLN